MSFQHQARHRWLRAAARGGAGVALAAALGVSGPVGGVAHAAPRAGDTTASSVDQACTPDSASAARVGRGTNHGQDPNSVSAGTSQRLDAALQRHVARLVRSGDLTRSRTRTDHRVIAIRTHVHVLEKSDGSGGVSRRQVEAQLRVLNAAYAGRTSAAAAPSPFRFTVASVDVTRNDAWYDWNLTPDQMDEDAEAKAAKRALHRGGWSDLNIYIASLSDGVLGYATFPHETPLTLDGLVVYNETLPGGDLAPYNEGDTATHEIGHWLGLFHTFENGCTPPGDHVQDTPYQADGDNVFFCGDTPEFGDDTCPQPGKDPVHNFMSYGDDPCLDRFTHGQVMRMVWTWLAFRRGQ
jgi:hypothetical protein